MQPNKGTPYRLVVIIPKIIYHGSDGANEEGLSSSTNPAYEMHNCLFLVLTLTIFVGFLVRDMVTDIVEDSQMNCIEL